MTWVRAPSTSNGRATTFSQATRCSMPATSWQESPRSTATRRRRRSSASRSNTKSCRRRLTSMLRWLKMPPYFLPDWKATTWARRSPTPTWRPTTGMNSATRKRALKSQPLWSSRNSNCRWCIRDTSNPTMPRRSGTKMTASASGPARRAPSPCARRPQVCSTSISPA